MLQSPISNHNKFDEQISIHLRVMWYQKDKIWIIDVSFPYNYSLNQIPLFKLKVLCLKNKRPLFKLKKPLFIEQIFLFNIKDILIQCNETLFMTIKMRIQSTEVINESKNIFGCILQTIIFPICDVIKKKKDNPFFLLVLTWMCYNIEALAEHFS